MWSVVYHWKVMADAKPAALRSTAASFLTDRVSRVRPNTRLIALLALGHLVIDTNQGSLAAVLPFLKSVHGLSYAEAGIIVLVANITSSIIQPLFGYLADQAVRRWLLPLSVFLSGVGLGLTGVAPGYGVVLLLVVVMGFGVAAYHPEGYRTAASVAGDRKATALSWFSLGGHVGVALGVLFLLTSGSPFAIVALGLFGAALVSTFTVSVVLGQAYLPRNPGMASGLIVGFAIGAGGLGVTLLGWVADHWGLPAVLWTCAFMPLLGFAVAFFLPQPRSEIA